MPVDQGPHALIYIGEPHVAYFGKVNDAGVPVLDEEGLTTWPGGTAVTNATMKAQLRESADPFTAIGSEVTMANVASSQGHYSGTIAASDTDDLVEGTEYYVHIYATAEGVNRWLLRKAAKRGEA